MMDVVDPLPRLGIRKNSRMPHTFGVRAVGLHHFAPFGGALAYGQLAIVHVVPKFTNEVQ